jgi:YidC/Oxa1 family membrane protein insertase
MERRVLVAIFLSFLVIYAWQAFFVKPAPKPVAPATTSSQVKPGTNTAAATPAPAPAPSEPKPAELPAQPMTSAVVVGETSERDIRVGTRDVIAVFTNCGARLKSWRLKR